jgi:IS6 family transposase
MPPLPCLTWECHEDSHNTIDKHGTSVDFLLTTKRDLKAVKRFFRKIRLHYVSKHLQKGIESGHFRVKRPMPRIGGFRSFHIARWTI